uniref:Uncharacterized protein n=1 Tax=Tanacetum cinerariifolium TaxID=118510 RepID=A0A699IHZ6_TANCI|nr:hypothetical protein [Tanacetum cinerariifolium]
MHIRCERGSIPEPRGQHERNQGLLRKSRSGDEATILQTLKEGSEKGVLRHEAMHSGTTTGDRTNTQRRANNVPLCGKEAILSRPKNTRRMLKWKFELEAFNITYRPRTSICSEVLANFIAERPNEEGPSMEAPAEGGNPRTVDPIQRRVIMPRRVRSRTHPHKPRKGGIHLCTKSLEEGGDFSADLDKNLFKLASFSLRLCPSFNVWRIVASSPLLLFLRRP